MAGRKKENEGRYSVPVTAEQNSLVIKEMEYQKTDEPMSTRCTRMGKLLGTLIGEAVTARFIKRGIKVEDESDLVDAADSDPCDADGNKDNPTGKPANVLTSEQLISDGNRPEVQSAIIRDGGGRSA